MLIKFAFDYDFAILIKNPANIKYFFEIFKRILYTKLFVCSFVIRKIVLK